MISRRDLLQWIPLAGLIPLLHKKEKTENVPVIQYSPQGKITNLEEIFAGSQWRCDDGRIGEEGDWVYRSGYAYLPCCTELARWGDSPRYNAFGHVRVEQNGQIKKGKIVDIDRGRFFSTSKTQYLPSEIQIVARHKIRAKEQHNLPIDYVY